MTSASTLWFPPVVLVGFCRTPVESSCVCVCVCVYVFLKGTKGTLTSQKTRLNPGMVLLDSLAAVLFTRCITHVIVLHRVQLYYTTWLYYVPYSCITHVIVLHTVHLYYTRCDCITQSAVVLHMWLYYVQCSFITHMIVLYRVQLYYTRDCIT